MTVAGTSAKQLTVVVATFERLRPLVRMLDDLAAQTLDPAEFEVVVIDDGSRDPVANHLDPKLQPYELSIVRQPNAGPAAARHAGAEIARGDVLVFLDDDMRLPPTFLAAHLAAHASTPRAVVVGYIRPAVAIASMPLFERFHAQRLEDHVGRLRDEKRAPVGSEVCSGNLSMRRADYFRVGGFDTTLGRSEDAELGVRLEKSGAKLVFSEDAYSIHDSDHTDARVWRRRAFLYGVYETRIGKKHPDVLRADPWHWLGVVPKARWPLLLFAAAAPRASTTLTSAFLLGASALDAVHLERAAQTGASLAYGVEYFRGVRAEEGSLGGLVRGFFAFRARAHRDGSMRSEGSMWKDALDNARRSIRADWDMLHRYDQKYQTGTPRGGSLARDLLYRAGFQMMVGFRLMRFFVDLGVPTGAKVISRGVRFLYGADMHWEAQIADGVCINHGMGLGISATSKIGKGCILAHNVSLGEGRDAATKEIGSPTLEENVHVGPGALILGPIVVGAGSKIGAGSVLRQSVPPRSIVEAPPPRIRQRTAGASTPIEIPNEPSGERPTAHG